MDIPYSGILGYFIGLQSCCDGLLCCKYKFNRQHSRKNNTQKWMLSLSCEFSKGRMSTIPDGERRRHFFCFSKVQYVSKSQEENRQCIQHTMLYALLVYACFCVNMCPGKDSMCTFKEDPLQDRNLQRVCVCVCAQLSVL